MSKKLPISLLFFFLALGIYAQPTIVGTAAEDRNVVLEEFTGINCVFCPEGHAIAQQLKDNNPADVFLVNIHSGGFASPSASQPDFRTQWGEAIDNQSGLAGYPAGTINRENFPGLEQGAPGSTAIGRGGWVNAANQVFAESSYLNMAVTASMDAPSNTMDILVEAFYTGDSPAATNFLNVAILQNNTTGPQSGGGAGNNYVHQHRLIDLVTGQWGEEISTVNTGDLISRTYSYNPPSDINGVPVDPSELEIVVFMTETTQLLVSGSGSLVSLEPLTNANDANVVSVSDIDDTCNTSITPSVLISNTGTDALTSLVITYDVNGENPVTFNWTGNLASLEAELVELPEISFTSGATNTVNVSVPNDDFNDNNASATTFGPAPETVGTMRLRVSLDNWAEECSWEFRDSSGTVLESGSYTGGAGTAGDDLTTFNYTFNFADDCITFSIEDTFGDGLTVGGNGGFELKDANDVIIYAFNDNFGSGVTLPFDSNGVLEIEDNRFNTITIYPNPATDIVNIKNAENSAIEVYNMLGQLVITKNNISADAQMNVSSLVTGTYFVKISNGNVTTTKKLLVSK
ncbi:T9SS type A sorting domain-containing protein [Patiriisocius sp. Uisw_017]|jgi:hypothetical protein|uniref:T9SS type A sorting domain-containing protein n=1 Tax=Patiriisocius sp. Uisw_017 TaxID=3230968 RepID=UPI0039EB2581